jgi:hypothetical protein
VVAIQVRVSSESRGRTQHGSSPAIFVLTEDGRRHFPSAAAQTTLERSLGPQPPLIRNVDPGESFKVLVAFDLPASTHRLRVDIAERPWITKLMLFDDNSLLAGRTRFEVMLPDG